MAAGAPASGPTDDRAHRCSASRRIGFSGGGGSRATSPGATSAATSCSNAPASSSSRTQFQGYFDRGAKRVDRRRRRSRTTAALNVVVGVNDDRYDPGAPPPADGGVLHHQLPGAGREGGAPGASASATARSPPSTTRPTPTWWSTRRTRICAAPARRCNSLQPTTTGSATAIGLIYPELKGRLGRPCGAGTGAERQPDRLRVRDCSARPRRPRSTTCSRRPPPGRSPASSGIEHRPLVSVDYVNDSRSAIVDAPSTLVTDGTMLKIYAWYDNEAGYACRMVDLAEIVRAAGA
jgi:glyceraldehyde 3-phosphate dehydrogenase